MVGYPLSGTTAMWKLLRQHPQVEVPQLGSRYIKELYAIVNVPPRFGINKPGPVLYPLEKTYSIYHAVFSGKTKYRLDASPDYIYIDGVIKRIKVLCPTAKVIICLREPLDHLRSLFQKMSLVRPERFKRPIHFGLDMPNQAGIAPTQRFDFANQIKKYIESFQKKNLKFVIFDYFINDNIKIIKEICFFLNIPEIPFKIEIIKTKKTLPIPKNYYEKGKKFFRRQVEDISQAIGIDLISLWGY